MSLVVRIVDEYFFAGSTQRELAVEGTDIRGTATQQPKGTWTWFLRYADGEPAGDGGARTWDGVEFGIQRSLVAEMKYGRLQDR